MDSINLLSKDSGLAITTQSSHVTAGKLTERASSFDMPAKDLDGTDVEIVWQEATGSYAW